MKTSKAVRLWRYKSRGEVHCDLGKVVVYRERETFVRKALT
jgi:hypothetical protein